MPASVVRMVTSISRSSSLVLPLLIAVLLMLLAVSGPSSARQLDLDDGDRSTSTGGGGSSFGVAGRPIIQIMKRLYLPQLAGPGHSCVSGPSSARQLDLDDGDRSTSTGGGGSSFGVAGRPIIQIMKRLYLPQLAGPGHSCGTYDRNNPNCPRRNP